MTKKYTIKGTERKTTATIKITETAVTKPEEVSMARMSKTIQIDGKINSSMDHQPKGIPGFFLDERTKLAKNIAIDAAQIVKRWL